MAGPVARKKQQDLGHWAAGGRQQALAGKKPQDPGQLGQQQAGAEQVEAGLETRQQAGSSRPWQSKTEQESRVSAS